MEVTSMANVPEHPKQTSKYVITSLVLTCFKAFQYIQRFEFSKLKRNMVILAANCSGKTSTVDGFEYILSEDGIVERIGEKEDKMLNKAGPVALKNAYRASKKFPSSASAQIEVYDENFDEKVTDFSIERFVGMSDKSISEIHAVFLKAMRVLPIIRGEESNAFVTALSPSRRFEKIVVWTRRKFLLDPLNQLRDIIAMAPTTLRTTNIEIVRLNSELADATNQNISEWNDTELLNYINEKFLVQIDPKLCMSKLARSDPGYQQLEERVEKLENPSVKVQERMKQEDQSFIQNAFEVIERLLDLSKEYSRLHLLEKNTESSLVESRDKLKIVSRGLVSEMQREVDQINETINEYFQHIIGVIDKKIKLHLELDEKTNQGLVHLSTNYTKNLPEAQPTGYLSNADKHAFTLAFQLAYIKEFNQGAKILILDDLVTSIDAGYRNRIVSLIFQKFSDFQIIATTHDDLFNLSMYASADLSKWTFCRIIRVDPDHGPIFDIFRPTREQMQFLWDHGQSALTLLRQQMEHDFEQLIVDLRIKMRLLKPAMFDSYSLNEKINAVRGFFKKIGLVVPKLEGVEKETLEYFAGAKYLNKGIHDRDKTHSAISIEDEDGLVNQYYTFLSWLKCGKCEHDRFRRIKGGKETEMVCQSCASKFEFQVADESTELADART